MDARPGRYRPPPRPAAPRRRRGQRRRVVRLVRLHLSRHLHRRPDLPPECRRLPGPPAVHLRRLRGRVLHAPRRRPAHGRRRGPARAPHRADRHHPADGRQRPPGRPDPDVRRRRRPRPGGAGRRPAAARPLRGRRVRRLHHLPRRVGRARQAWPVLQLPVRLHHHRAARRLRHRRRPRRRAGRAAHGGVGLARPVPPGGGPQPRRLLDPARRRGDPPARGEGAEQTLRPTGDAAEQTVRPAWDAAARPRPGLFDALRRHPRESLLICGITAGGTLAYYTWTSYLPTYAELNAGVGKADALLAGTLSLGFFALLQPLGGLLSDRYGRKPPLLLFGLGFTLLTVPLLRATGDSFGSLLLVQCAGMVLLTGFTSVSAAVNAEVFPARVRAAGIGFPYSLTVALFGGTAPYVGTLFTELGRPGLFPWYVSVVCLVSSAVYLRLPESAHKELER
ncbi:MFS transporter [Streptomyces sp. WAC05374]|uniref:MFS transporter n=1 Tax=Streptomyces sp. WAC05374 TaxID=2487420 RepID=UPI0037DC16D0